MKQITKNFVLINLGIFFLFLADRFLKWSAISFLGEGQNYVFLKFFRIELYLNKGIAFSVPFYLPLIYFVNLSILLILFAFLRKEYLKKNQAAVAGLTLIAVGAISNLLDRLIQGAVIDFVNLRILPIFNLADLMIIAGVLVLVFHMRTLNNYKTLSS
ncbi:MAG: signal peptidase II [Candidatus Kerfeldbacteria bacterium CG_4_10_14_0_8_um_filter_42_10]|uniref:Lipoprotein signal peptidase n=1 Tax=Candidatus Kerfeldbacteria bacterium CG_4_10_14_0_8_um_filter_42_10 TaxID=2014248 RepID=A0A2M7RJY0_9BACT|nr:MAG: signal peptidase II [Candidatus Kerfeldbacteria bacterium CG_4_10_14_0_8_um_filter_42_10]